MNPETGKQFEDPNFYTLVENTAKKMGIEDFKINFKPSIGPGLGYLGDIYRLNIEGTLHGEKQVIPIIAKVLQKDEMKRQLIQLEALSGRECMIYNEVFPLLDLIQDECNVEEKFPHATSYLATNEKYKEMILMHDLAKDGFQPPKVGKDLDSNHVKLLLESLGQYHALCLACKHRHPDKFEKLSANVYELHVTDDSGNLKGMYYESLEHAVTVVPEVKDSLLEIMDGAYQIAVKYFSEPDQQYSVLNHGDGWANNFLYAYEGDVPKKLIIIDWQMIRYQPPVLDFFFSVFMAASNDQRGEDGFENLCSLHYDSIARHLKQLNLDPKLMYPRSVYRQHVREMVIPMAVVAVFMLPIFFSDHDGEMAYDSDEAGHGSGMKMSQMRPTPLYISKIKQLVCDIKYVLSHF